MSSEIKRACPICRRYDGPPLGSLQKTVPYALSQELYQLVKCNNCDLIYLDAELTQSDLKVLYEDSVQFTSPAYRDQNKVLAALNYYGDCYRKMLGLMHQAGKQVKVLEVGAGLAWVCRVAKTENNALTVAQDVSPECKDECPWVDNYIVSEIRDPLIKHLGPYNVISLTHVIEHLTDPVEVLRRLSTLLDMPGCIFITAPCRPKDWSDQNLLPVWRNWSYNHVPAHLQYFSERTMELAAAQSNLKLVQWSLHEDGQALEAILQAE